MIVLLRLVIKVYVIFSPLKDIVMNTPPEVIFVPDHGAYFYKKITFLFFCLYHARVVLKTASHYPLFVYSYISKMSAALEIRKK